MARKISGLWGISDLPFRFVFLMWVTFTVQFYTELNLYVLGVKPRNLFGLIGILTGPLIHSGFYHIMSNSIPILFLGTMLFFFYNRIGKSVFFASYFLPNVLVWLFSPRPTFHIGASGIVYSLAAFLIVIGFLKREFFPLLVSAVVILVYGGIFLYGLVPSDVSISWEAHLGGVLVGVSAALYHHFKN
jgi:membrane associated rhomboid family serine protease